MSYAGTLASEKPEGFETSPAFARFAEDALAEEADEVGEAVDAEAEAEAEDTLDEERVAEELLELATEALEEERGAEEALELANDAFERELSTLADEREAPLEPLAADVSFADCPAAPEHPANKTATTTRTASAPSTFTPSNRFSLA